MSSVVLQVPVMKSSADSSGNLDPFYSTCVEPKLCVRINCCSSGCPGITELHCTVEFGCLQPCPRLRSFLGEYRWLSECVRKVGFSSPELFFDSRLWYKLICGFL